MIVCASECEWATLRFSTTNPNSIFMGEMIDILSQCSWYCMHTVNLLYALLWHSICYCCWCCCCIENPTEKGIESFGTWNSSWWCSSVEKCIGRMFEFRYTNRKLTEHIAFKNKYGINRGIGNENKETAEQKWGANEERRRAKERKRNNRRKSKCYYTYAKWFEV